MTHAPSITLYADHQYASPWAMSVFVTLQEKQLANRIETLNLGEAEHLGGLYTRQSMTGRVPALCHNGFWLSESSAITEYLEDTYSPPDFAPVYPASPHDKARARQLQAWLRSDLQALRSERTTEVVFYGQASAPLTPQGQAAADKLMHMADALLTTATAHVFGARSIVDTELALMLQRLLCHGDAVPAKLATYAQRQWQRPSVQAWLNQPRPAL